MSNIELTSEKKLDKGEEMTTLKFIRTRNYNVMIIGFGELRHHKIIAYPTSSVKLFYEMGIEKLI